MLLLWQPVWNAYHEMGKEFPLGHDHQIILYRISLHNLCSVKDPEASTVHEAFCRDEFFTLLDSHAPLKLHDPAAVAIADADGNTLNAGGEGGHLKLKLDANKVDKRTMVAVHVMLREAFSSRFFYCYHPIEGLYRPSNFYGRDFNRNKNIAEQGNFKFSYLIDMQAMLHPTLSSGTLLKKVIISMDGALIALSSGTSYTVPHLHGYKLVTEFIWCTISQLAESVAFTYLLPDIPCIINLIQNHSYTSQGSFTCRGFLVHG